MPPFRRMTSAVALMVGVILGTSAVWPVVPASAGGRVGAVQVDNGAVGGSEPTELADSTSTRAPTSTRRAWSVAWHRPSLNPAPAEAAVGRIVLGPVVTYEPRVRLIVPAGEVETVAARLRTVPGVAVAAGLVHGAVRVTAADGVPETITVAAVDPAAFRALTPQPTAETIGVWQRLLDGDAVFTHEVATRLALPLGGSVAADGTDLRVGAVASNGVPPVADAIVSRRAAARLGLEGEGSVLVAPASGVAPEALADRLEAVTGARPAVLPRPRARQAFLTGSATRDAFEPFTYIDNGDGLIQIDPAWVQRHIATADVPILDGVVRCHRLLLDQLRGALAELEAQGLSELIDPGQYGGCHVARHIDFDPDKPLSMHAWGLAVDLNVATNGLGETPQIDPRVVEVFERWGFAWGGRWARPDGMHFELAALLEPLPD